MKKESPIRFTLMFLFFKLRFGRSLMQQKTYKLGETVVLLTLSNFCRYWILTYLWGEASRYHQSPIKPIIRSCRVVNGVWFFQLDINYPSLMKSTNSFLFFISKLTLTNLSNFFNQSFQFFRVNSLINSQLLYRHTVFRIFDGLLFCLLSTNLSMKSRKGQRTLSFIYLYVFFWIHSSLTKFVI
jgi:hypothetical protein